MRIDSFTTDRLTAERLTAEHLGELRRIHSDADFMAHLGGMRDESESTAYLARNLQHWHDHGYGIWVLRDAGCGRVAGLGLLGHLLLDGTDEVEVGYGFYPEFWGRGLATEIAAACLRLGRDRLGLASIVGLTLPESVGSQRVLAKVGLVYERDVWYEGMLNAMFRTAV